MTEQQKMHILVQELLPLYEELDQETQQIVDAHKKNCSQCATQTKNVEFLTVPPLQIIEQGEPASFLTIAHFKNALLFFSVGIRILLIALGYLAIKLCDPTFAQQRQFVDQALLYIYLPFASFHFVGMLRYFSVWKAYAFFGLDLVTALGVSYINWLTLT